MYAVEQYQVFGRLAEFPQSGCIVPEFGIVNLREVIFSPFRIVYRLGKDRVKIVRIWRSERPLKMPQRDKSEGGVTIPTGQRDLAVKEKD